MALCVVQANNAQKSQHGDLENGKLENGSATRTADAVGSKPGVAAPPIQPPNGGLEAWLFVLAGFFIFINSWYDVARLWLNVVVAVDTALGGSRALTAPSKSTTGQSSCQVTPRRPCPGLAAYNLPWSPLLVF